ncbi:hypothetical protein WJX74_001002 [Apatococcus lobatus]|uniref:AAA+ ATPase domain-containing protein n=1 Tax=Apatococcus lobatus TaxID=904363 RepID=A0AAW1QVZ3_9CHLO
MLLSLFGREAKAALPCTFVYGPSSTGKTSIVRDTLRELQKQTTTKRKRGDLSTSSPSSSDQTADLLIQLADTASQQSSWIAIVIDQAETIADQSTMALFTRIRELTDAKMAVIFISQLAWGSNAFEHDMLHATRPSMVRFPAYSLPELTKIMALSAPMGAEAACYIRFLQQVLPSFVRVTRRLEELQGRAQSLWPAYISPVCTGNVQQQEAARLWQLFLPHLHKSCSSASAGRQEAASSQPSSGVLDFELPFMSKFLLLAAYVAARNKPTLDRRLFDPKAKAARRKGALAQDRQVEAAREARVQGPSPFALERLLYIFWGLLRCSCDDTDDEPFTPVDELSAGIFMQISTLVSLQLLTQVNNELDLDIKYRCNVSDALAQKIASNVSIQLQQYVLYV